MKSLSSIGVLSKSVFVKFQFAKTDLKSEKSLKVAPVIDLRVAAERHVKKTAGIEPAEAIEPRAIQVVEQHRSFRCLPGSALEELVEPNPRPIEMLRVVPHRDRRLEPALQPRVETDDVGIDVVQQRPLGQEPRRHRQPPAEGFHEPTALVVLPIRLEMGELPALPTSPFEGRTDSGRFDAYRIGVRADGAGYRPHYFSGPDSSTSCVHDSPDPQDQGVNGSAGRSALLKLRDLIRRPFPQLSGLIDDCCRRQKLCWVEFGDREAVEPALPAARPALYSKPIHVPLAGFNPVRPALTKHEGRHGWP